MIAQQLWTELKSALGEERLREIKETGHPLGNGAEIAVYPETEEEIQRILTYANNHQKTVAIAGGGTKRGFGGTLPSYDLLLSLEKYEGIVEHIVGDMTVTVKAGTKFQTLQNYLAQYNQKISLDPEWPEDATIGGVIAANDSGPKRLGYGSARDEVIGMRIVYPNGTVIRTGGKVVKNVAGYDMNKLFIGSMGTIGVISEITLKLRPVPKYESVMLVFFPERNLEDIKNFAIKLLDSKMEPVSLELFNPSLAKHLTGEESYMAAVSLEDVESSVRYQEEYIKKLVPQKAKLDIYREDEAGSFWNDVYKIGPSGAQSREEGNVRSSLKVGVVNLDVIQIIHESDLMKDKYNLDVWAHGGLGHGLCKVHMRGAEEDTISALEKMRETAAALGGYAVAKHLPLSLRQKVDVWGEKPPYQFLLEGIKQKIDPNKILNRSRFVGGI